MAEVIDKPKEEVWLVLSGVAKTDDPEALEKMEKQVRQVAKAYMTDTATDMSHSVPHTPTPEIIAEIKKMFAPAVHSLKPNLSMVDLEARRQQSIENGKERREQRYGKEYIVAEKVAAIPNLTASERCHAVVYGLKKLNDRERTELHNEKLSMQLGGPVYDARVKFNTAGEYGHFHDTMKFDDIEKGIHRSATALFD